MDAIALSLNESLESSICNVSETVALARVTDRLGLGPNAWILQMFNSAIRMYKSYPGTSASLMNEMCSPWTSFHPHKSPHNWQCKSVPLRRSGNDCELNNWRPSLSLSSSPPKWVGPLLLAALLMSSSKNSTTLSLRLPCFFRSSKSASSAAGKRNQMHWRWGLKKTFL